MELRAICYHPLISTFDPVRKQAVIGSPISSIEALLVYCSMNRFGISLGIGVPSTRI